MVRRTIAVAVAIAGTALLPAAPVFAHASLQDSDPAANSVLTEAPTSVSLDFDEEVEPSLSAINLYGADGAEIEVGDTVTGADGSIVKVDLPTLDDGLYAVVWQVTSDDGHVVDGAFSFQVGTAVTGDADALIDEVRSGSDGGGALEFWYAVARFVSLLGVVLCIGGIGWSAATLGGLVSPVRLARLRWIAVVLLGGGSIAAFLLFATRADASSLADAVSSSTGRMLLVRAVLTVPVIALAASWSRHTSTAWRFVAVLVAVSLAVSCSASGHPNSLHPAWLWIAVDMLHVLSIAAWLGGLAVLVLADRSQLAEPEAVRPVRRFSAVAAGAVAVAVATGIAQTLRLSGGLDDVTSTDWGRLLLVKVMVVLAMVAVAGVTRWLLHHDGPGSLRRTVLLEAAAGAVVLALAAGMVGLAPRAGAPSRPFDEQLVSGSTIAAVSISPGRVGTNEVHILVTPAGGSLTAVDAATARVSLPAASIPVSPVTLVDEGPNHYSGTVAFPRAGDWTFDVVLTIGSETILLSTTVTIP